MKLIRKILIFFARIILSSRYQIKITNPEILKNAKQSLILPNHVALVDPIILVSYLSKYTFLSPLASRKFYDKK